MRAYSNVQQLLCHGSYCELILSLARTSCRLLFTARPTARLLAGNPLRDAVCSRNTSKSTLARDAVATALLHKHCLIICVGVGLIQFVYRSHLRLATEVARNRNAFSPFFARDFERDCGSTRNLLFRGVHKRMFVKDQSHQKEKETLNPKDIELEVRALPRRATTFVSGYLSCACARVSARWDESIRVCVPIFFWTLDSFPKRYLQANSGSGKAIMLSAYAVCGSTVRMGYIDMCGEHICRYIDMCREHICRYIDMCREHICRYIDMCREHICRYIDMCREHKCRYKDMCREHICIREHICRYIDMCREHICRYIDMCREHICRYIDICREHICRYMDMCREHICRYIDMCREHICRYINMCGVYHASTEA